MGNRALKKRFFDLLSSDDFSANLNVFREFSSRKAVNPLFSYFYATDSIIRWHAISAMGVVAAHAADTDLEFARVVMRRLLWNLNDESGGIGWGSPEALGEIMACHSVLADEFAKLLRSYVMPHGNFLEHEALQRGVLWGLGRLAQVRPRHVFEAGPFLTDFLQSSDPSHRGLSAWICGAIQYMQAVPFLDDLIGDPTVIELYDDLRLKSVAVGNLAAEAVAGIQP